MVRFTTSLSGMLSGWMKLAVSLKCTVQITRTAALIRSGSRVDVSQYRQYDKCVRSKKDMRILWRPSAAGVGGFEFGRVSAVEAAPCSGIPSTQREAQQWASPDSSQFTLQKLSCFLTPPTLAGVGGTRRTADGIPSLFAFVDDEASLWLQCNYPAVGSVFHFILWLNYSE